MHFPHPGGPGIGLGGVGLFGGIFADVLAGLVFIICSVIVVGLLVVLVRFLLVATRAAELYIANNPTSTRGAATPVAAPAKPATASSTAANPAAPSTSTRSAPTKPTPKPKA